MIRSNSLTDGSASQTLLPQHEDYLHRCGITPEVAKARGYHSLKKPKQLSELGYQPHQGGLPAIAIPIRGLGDEVIVNLIRPDKPRCKDGRVLEYELPKGSSIPLDIPASTRSVLNNTDQELWIAECPEQADALISAGLYTIAIIGNQGWHHICGPNQNPLRAWGKISLEGRTVVIAQSSDANSTPERREELNRFAMFLQSRGAKVQFAIPVPGPNGELVKISDVVARGDDPRNLIVEAPSDLAEELSDFTDRYKADDTGTYRITSDKKGDEKVQLATLSAKIIEECHVTDGQEKHIEFLIKAQLGDRTREFSICAEEFERMGWPLRYLGAEAVVCAGYNVKDQLREAIQRLSGKPHRVDVKTCLGWVKYCGRWVFLHAGGIIDPDSDPAIDGPIESRDDPKSQGANTLAATIPKNPISPQKRADSSIRVRLPSAFRNYSLPKPRRGKKLAEDIRATLRILELGPDRIMLPLLAIPFRAVLGATRWGVFLHGPTGNFKTHIMLLLAQFFGPNITESDLFSWDSTGNALLAFSHSAKDVLFPVDDFRLSGTQGDIANSNRQADRLLRAQGNRSGRARLRADGSVCEGKEPRGLIACTGESLPSGHSLNARFLSIEIEEGEILDRTSTERMTLINEVQEYAKSGHFARTMAAFIAWVAPQYEDLRQEVQEAKERFRPVFYEDGLHARLVDIAADLLAGFDQFLFFAWQYGDIDRTERDAIWGRMHHALRELLAKQKDEIASEDPLTRFLELLASALHTGRAHLKFLHPIEDDKDAAGSPSLWGYHEIEEWVPGRASSSGQSENRDDAAEPEVDRDKSEGEWRTKLISRGTQVGWKDFDNIYLNPDQCLAVVNSFARQKGESSIPLTKKALGKRLVEKGMVIRHENDRNTYRRLIEGRRCEVFHIVSYEFVDLLWHQQDDVTFLEERQRGDQDFKQRREAVERAYNRHRQLAEIKRQKEFMKLLDP